MIHAIIIGRNIEVCTPALLTFLGKRNPEIFVYLLLNDINLNGNIILNLFPKNNIEVIRNPYTVGDCKGSYSHFRYLSLKKFFEILSGKTQGNFDNDMIMFLDDDIFIPRLKELSEEDLPWVPKLEPMFEDFNKEWLKLEARFWDSYGLVIKGEWLKFILEGLERATILNLHVGEFIFATTYLTQRIQKKINVDQDYIAYNIKQQKLKEGCVEESLNNILIDYNREKYGNINS